MAALPEGESRGLCLVQLCIKYRQGSAILESLMLSLIPRLSGKFWNEPTQYACRAVFVSVNPVCHVLVMIFIAYYLYLCSHLVVKVTN